ncbi:MAG TPA: Rieske 2Fe-2S domain-containing protein [Polyangiales bacterium]
MTKQVRLGLLSEIPEGEGRNFQVGERSIAVFHTRGGELFATQALCPHRQGPLADGLVGGSTLVCPLHDWSFDLTNGKTLNGTCDIAVYALARAADGSLLVELPDD